MDNSIDHRHLALKITFFVALAWGVSPLAVAELAADSGAGLTLESMDDAAKSPTIRDVPTATGMATESGKAPGATASSLHHLDLQPMRDVVPHMAADVPLGQEIRSSIKETLRPLHDDLANTGIFSAVRNLEAELGLSNSVEHKERTDGARSSGNPNNNEPRAMSWGNNGDGSGTTERPRTAAQAREDEIRASMMLQQLIDEVTPWLIAAVTIYLLGYGIKLFLAYKRAKRMRRQSRRARRSRHKRTSRQPSEMPQAKALSVDMAETANNDAEAKGASP